MADIADIRKYLNDGEELPAYAWPGGYPMYYLSEDGQEWCPRCANQTDAEPPVAYAEVHWEGEPLICNGCGAEIESAYGDPEKESADRLTEPN